MIGHRRPGDVKWTSPPIKKWTQCIPAEVEDICWGNAERLFGERQRKFVAEHADPLALPEPELARAEEYVRTANNNYTASLRAPNL